MRSVPDFPQNLLDRVNAAEYSPSRDANVKYIFHVVHSEAEDLSAFEETDSEDEEVESEDGDSPRQHTFDTLGEANKAALALFRSEYEDFFDQKEDMSNWYEEGTSELMMNDVIWQVVDGLVSLQAHDAEEGIVGQIYVSASRV
ncbi:hypothetical protein PENPOL_c001G08486 [Penicillium polonicum]|uniref:Uncharacterized protein n=1 Tax=Penicillium polonicum TaxID=60169 RepID=A0A1V6P5G1_PENPO|nr:hypothetical protein PENPOL_c001G08486 [Penicillium polonicum]